MARLAAVRIFPLGSALALLMVGLLLLGGCSLFGGSPSGPQSYTTQNDLVVFTRTVPQSVPVGTVFTVQVILKAKVALQLAAVTEQLPPGFLAPGGDSSLTAFRNNLKPGDQVKLTYQIQASSQAGTFQVWGKARAMVTAEQGSVPLMLGSPVKVTH